MEASQYSLAYGDHTAMTSRQQKGGNNAAVGTYEECLPEVSGK